MRILQHVKGTKGSTGATHRQMAQKRMMQHVPKVDVVIVNPIRVAVVLKYDEGKVAALIVIAKCHDEVAQRIKAIAKEHGITLVEDVPLSGALVKDDPSRKPIPTQLFKAVAQVLFRACEFR